MSRSLRPGVAAAFALVLAAPGPARAQCSGTTCALTATGHAPTDTAALQAALNHNAGGARTVELTGTFQLTANVYVNHDDTTIRGAGRIVGPSFVFWPNTWQPHVGIRIWGGEHVAWTDGNDVSANGSTITKTTADAWTGGAISTRAIQPGLGITPILPGDGFVEFTPGNTNTYRLLGLTQGGAGMRQPGLIDFALYMDAAANLYVFEAGYPVGWVGRYGASDRLRIGVEEDRIHYRKNGALLYRSRRLPQYPLVVAASMYSQGATIQNAVVGGLVGPYTGAAHYGRRIMPGEKAYSVPNAYSPGDMVMVWNYPADPIKRRKEFSVAADDSTSTRLSLRDAALFEYLEGVSFTKVAPRRNVVIEGVTLDTVAVNVNFGRDVTVRNLTARRVGFRATACYSCSVLNLDFDSKGDDPNSGTSSAVDFGEGSRNVLVAGGTYRRYRGFEEPGPIKVNQTASVVIRDLTIEDVHTVNFDHTFSPDGRPIFKDDPRAKMSGIMIDTNVGNNPTGYTDVPTVDTLISNVTVNDADFGIFATTFSHTPIQKLRIVGYNRTSSDGAPLYIRGSEDVYMENLSLPSPRDHLRIESSTRVQVVNTDPSRSINRVVLQNLGRTFASWGSRRNSDITFQGVTFSPRQYVAYQNTLLPIFYDVDDLRLSDVRFVADGANQVGLGAAWFEAVHNVTLRNVTVSPADSPLWAWSAIGGFLGGNPNVILGGAVSWPSLAGGSSVPAGQVFNVAGEAGWSYLSNGATYCRLYPARGSEVLLGARPYNQQYTYECPSSSTAFRVSDFTYFSSGQAFCMFAPEATLPASVATFARYPELPYLGYCP